MKFLSRSVIRDETDVYLAIHHVSLQAKAMELNVVQLSKLKTTISELGHNIVKYAKRGRIDFYILEKPKRGIQIVATDNGPGIRDLEKAMTDNYSSSGTLGLGLPGVKRLVDEFSIQSLVNVGTTVTTVLYDRA